MTTALLLTSLALFGHAPMASKVALSESLRYETRTTSFGNSSETETAYRSKFSATVELPITGMKVDASTPVEVTIGEFKFRGELRDDAGFHEGASAAHLALTFTAGDKGTKIVGAKVDVQWSGDKATFKISGDGPGTPGVVAMTFKDYQIGPFDAVTQASVRFGDKKLETSLPLKGKIGRKSVDVPGLSGSATTVDLKGEAKGS